MPAEERGPGSGCARTSRGEEIGVSLATPEKIRKLQRALYVKAKQEPTRRFHFLYDKVWRGEILSPALPRCPGKSGGGGGGGGDLSCPRIYWGGGGGAAKRGGGWKAHPPTPPV